MRHPAPCVAIRCVKQGRIARAVQQTAASRLTSHPQINHLQINHLLTNHRQINHLPTNRLPMVRAGDVSARPIPPAATRGY